MMLRTTRWLLTVGSLAGWAALALGNEGCAPPAAAGKEAIVGKHAIGPRKVVVGTAMFGMWGDYPGLDQRLDQLGGLVDEMARQAREKYGPEARLDLAVLPEEAVTGGRRGTAAERAAPLEGPVLEKMGAKAREHQCYLVVPLDLAEERAVRGAAGRVYSNAAVLLDRAGQVAGIYRKVHTVAGPAVGETEGGLTPGREFPVFACDFGKLGLQICFDMAYDDGWRTLKRKGAELIAWPTQSPQTVVPASRAMANGCYLVSSTWRDNAALFDPTGQVVAQITKPAERVLVRQIDLDYAILDWQAKLDDGKIFDRKYGAKAGHRYSAREDCGLFWSNDPARPIANMVRELGLETHTASLARQKAVQDAVRPGPPEGGR
jgi:predicted amidohydrolase